jgi:hypothetical protein
LNAALHRLFAQPPFNARFDRGWPVRNDIAALLIYAPIAATLLAVRSIPFFAARRCIQYRAKVFVRAQSKSTA